MNTRISLVASVLLAGFLGSGCASGARIVRSGPGGGEMAMWGPVMPAAHHGRELLVHECPGGYAVNATGEGLGLGHATAALPEATARAGVASDARVVTFRCELDGAVLARR